MKKLLVFTFLPFALAACYGGSGGSSTKNKTFNQTIAELEKEPLKSPEEVNAATATALQTADDRAQDVALAAQQERRAAPPLVESNYIFNIMPDKGTYSFDEYNQVWTDAPKEKDYKGAKRLWEKPKRHKGDSYDAEPAAGQATTPAQAEFSDSMFEDD
jgi:hypothetical protein